MSTNELNEMLDILLNQATNCINDSNTTVIEDVSLDSFKFVIETCKGVINNVNQ